jgi:hypothetical protein
LGLLACYPLVTITLPKPVNVRPSKVQVIAPVAVSAVSVTGVPRLAGFADCVTAPVSEIVVPVAVAVAIPVTGQVHSSGAKAGTPCKPVSTPFPDSSAGDPLTWTLTVVGDVLKGGPNEGGSSSFP